MEVLGPDQRAETAGTAVTIGAYDGVHVGHRRLLADLRQSAADRGLRSAVVTFDRHPATVVRPESAPPQLTDLEQKLELLADCGIDLTMVIPFDRARADESAEDFVGEILVGALGARVVVVGRDFHFGHGRKGNVRLLDELGRIEGFEVEGIELTAEHGEPISSTRIRHLIAAGEVAEAATLLGRPHELRGPVVRGDGRGASLLGFPTANVAVAEGMAVPGLGIYAGRFRRPDGSVHPAAISVGVRPTFYEDGTQRPLVEAYLLDFEGDLYGERAAVSFVERLREEVRFERVDDLVAQMKQDVAQARSLLGAF